MESLSRGRALDKEEVASLVEQARDWAVANGILMIPKDSPGRYMAHATFTLFPSFLPRKLFKQGLDVQRDFNLLIDKVSKDHEFLQCSLER